MTYKIEFSNRPQAGPLRARQLRVGQPTHRAGFGPTVILAPGLDPEATSYKALPLPGGNLGLFPGDEALVLLSSYRGYTRGGRGRVDLVSGQATLLTEGWIPFGDAGGLGGAHEALYRLEGPALFRVVPSRKEGIPHFWVVVAPGEPPRGYTPQEAQAHVAMGTDPLLVGLVQGLPEFAEALAMAQVLARETQAQEEAQGDEEEGGIWGVNLPFLSPKEALKQLGLHAPGGLKGVSGVGPGGVLIPGKAPLLVFRVDKARKEDLVEFSIENAQEVVAHKGDSWDHRLGLYAVIPGPNFRVRWVTRRGGVLEAHELTLEGFRRGDGLFLEWEEIPL